METNPIQKILIAEPDTKNAELLEQYVHLMGFEALCVNEGGGALDAVQDWKPDLIITELDLPGTTGMMFLKKIKNDSKTSEIPVIVMSEKQEEEVILVTLSSGASDFMAKPIKMAELTPKIQHALEIKNYRLELQLVNQRLEKEKRGLSRFFSEDVASQIISGEISPKLGGDSLDATIMFCDIRNSVALGEKLTPPQFAQFLSDILGRFMQIIFDHGGSVNKLLGDGILATFGCPVATDRDALNSVQSAIAIRKSLIDYNQNKPDYLDEKINFGIGIATGKVFAGNVGSDQRLEYTVIGDAVNLAARLEKMNKKLKTDVLLCGTTKEKAGDTVQFDEGIMGQISGKASPVQIFPLKS